MGLYEEKYLSKQTGKVERNCQRNNNVACDVKNLTAYITKLAESESEELDLTSGELPLCFDADAGGGRFLAIFTFLNRKDGEVKLHPFLAFKGSDSRKNLEMTFGRFTEDIRN